MTNFLNNTYVIINGSILIAWILYCVLKTIGYLNDRNKTIYIPMFESELIRKAEGSTIKYFFIVMFNKVTLGTVIITGIAINLLEFIL